MSDSRSTKEKGNLLLKSSEVKKKKLVFFIRPRRIILGLIIYLVNTLRVIIVPCAVINFLFNQDNTRLKSSPSFSSLQYQDAGNYVCETALQEVEGLKKRESLTLIVEGNKILEYSLHFFFENLLSG